MSSLKEQLTQAMKDAMRAKDKPRLGVIRLALAAIKQVEVDKREPLSEESSLALLDKLIKQRKDSATQYRDAGRADLADQEDAEVVILQEFLPAALSEQEVDTLIDQAIASTGAAGMQDMGKVMGVLKPQLQGRADMGSASGKVKATLSS